MRNYLYFAIAFLFVCSASVVLAQPTVDPDPPGTDIPIDGGISLLALGAGALGAYKLKKKKAEEHID